MTLVTRGDYSYSDTQQDIPAELIDFSTRGSRYPARHFVDAVCRCGGRQFTVPMDDEQGVVLRVCDSCGNRHPVGDSDEFLEDAELVDRECPCGGTVFEMTIGVALYAKSEDVKWLYVGLRCVACGLTACYGEWKNEYIGYRELLAKV